MRLPEDPDYAGGSAPIVEGLLTYNARGLPETATARFLDRSTELLIEKHDVVDAISYLRDGLVSSITYGDDTEADGTSRTPTVSTTTYDARRRPIRMRTTRTPLPGHAAGSGEELEAVSVVFDQELVWDAANNLTRQIDHRLAGEWPSGHRPQSVDIAHDALYRVIGADYEYTQSDGTRSVTDGATDWRTEFGQSAAATVDPMHPEPPAMVTNSATGRVVSLTWEWDYLANNTEWTDDQGQFYERSLGGIANGNGLTDGDRPSALYLASDISAGAGGWVEVDYGVGGNVTAMTVHGQCTSAGGTCADPGGTNLTSRLTALRSDCSCAVEQHYVYRWDELDRLAEARRYDNTGGGGWSLEVRQRYRYDGANQRVVKQNLDQSGCNAAPAGTGQIPCERTALYPYPGDFERRGLYADQVGLTYAPAGADTPTETQYVVAGARSVWRSNSSLNDFDPAERLVVPVSDLIQTSSAVFDLRSGKLLEASTYYPNGGRETFLNDDTDWVSPEINGFTGKEADEEVGVAYFGERYLIPRLGRWASPDPLHVHASGGGEALNSYHYVSGNLLAARDPLGLDDYTPADQNSSYVDTTCSGNTSCGEGGAVADAPATPPSTPPGRLPGVPAWVPLPSDPMNAPEVDRPDHTHQAANPQQRWLYRRANPSAISEGFVLHYMENTGTPVLLSESQIAEIQVAGQSVSANQEINERIEGLRAAGGGSFETGVFQLDMQAQTNGTLAYFTAWLRGTVTVQENGSFRFEGEMSVFDLWDFDPSEHRDAMAEARVTIGRNFIPGREFYVFSPAIPVTQQFNTDDRAPGHHTLRPVSPTARSTTPRDSDSIRFPLPIFAADVGADVAAEQTAFE